MRILAIDPGPEESGVVMYNPLLVGSPIAWAKSELNVILVGEIADEPTWGNLVLAIEQVTCYGMPVGAEVFETVWWTGRFCQVAQHYVRVPRLDVKMHLCHNSRAKDPNIRQALIDRFGGKAKAIGKKATPGPLYGIKSHLWAALAVAVYAADKEAGHGA